MCKEKWSFSRSANISSSSDVYRFRLHAVFLSFQWKCNRFSGTKSIWCTKHPFHCPRFILPIIWSKIYWMNIFDSSNSTSIPKLMWHSLLYLVGPLLLACFQKLVRSNGDKKNTQPDNSFFHSNKCFWLCLLFSIKSFLNALAYEMRTALFLFNVSLSSIVVTI